MLSRIFLLVSMVVCVGRTTLAVPTPPIPKIVKILEKKAQGVCDTRQTSDGDCCVFPFTYKGEVYYECTTKDHGKEWCAITEDFENYSSEWGNCTGKPQKNTFDVILDNNKPLIVNKNTRFGGIGQGIELFEGDILVDDDIRRRFLNKTTSTGSTTGSAGSTTGSGGSTTGSGGSTTGSGGSTGRTKRAVIKASQRSLWKDRYGKPWIPYEIQPSNYHAKTSILRAMSHLKSKVPCLRFVPRTNGMGGAYLSFHNGGGCWSMVGRVSSGRQLISIGNGCTSRGTIAHEIMHALGFWHEQSRPDRDQYVTIRWHNIVKGFEGNFQKQPYSVINSLGVPYDYKSVMHYGPTFFAKRGTKYTIVGKGGRLDFGQRYGVSVKDALQLNKLYCGNTGPKPPQPPKPSGCRYKDRYSNCPYWKSIGYCTNQRYAKFMRNNCAKSCLCKQRCVDLKPYCLKWKKAKFCTHPKYRLYVRSNCKKTCGVCR